MSPDDAFDLLAAANPVSDASALPLPPLEDLVPEAWDSRPLPRARPRRRRLLWLAPLVVAGTATAAAALLAERPTNPLDIGCYASASLRADTVVVRAERQDAVATCGRLWRDGRVGSGPTPPLHACVLASGATGVFPGDATVCRQVRGTTTTAVGATEPDDPQAVIAFRTALVERVREDTCLSAAAARGEAERQLQRFDLQGWTFQVGPGAHDHGFDAERPCATYSIDPTRRVVTLVPSPHS
jgi:hypothetical protein